MTPAATLHCERLGDNVVVSVIGELDVFNAAEIVAAIEAAVPAEAHAAVIDLTGVGFLDSTAIRTLFGLTSRLRDRRQRVVIVTPGGSTVLRTLQLVEFSRVAPLHDSLEDALAELDSDAVEPAEQQPSS